MGPECPIERNYPLRRRIGLKYFEDVENSKPPAMPSSEYLCKISASLSCLEVAKKFGGYYV